MELINPDIEKDLAIEKPLKIELGSAGKYREGYYGLDHLKMDGVDIVADLNKPLEKIPENSVSHIYSRHALEHVIEFLPLMKELHRIARSGCILNIVVPHFSNPYYYSDPTHVRFFGLYTMNYFVSPEKQPFPKRLVPAFYTDTRYEIDTIKISFYRMNIFDRVTVPLLRKIVNLNFAMQDFYERRLCRLFPASEISYTLRVAK
ncbi:MAG: methyltransferase type 11 [Gammaproteobacteria bacterium]|nr:methyltransferase type 11 [Gammaproteobacteria bacterium]